MLFNENSIVPDVNALNLKERSENILFVQKSTLERIGITIATMSQLLFISWDIYSQITMF